MTGEPRLIKATTNSRFNIRSWLDVLIALMLIALGIVGMLLALQTRPYLGTPATDLADVPIRIMAAPNVGTISLLLLAIGLGVTGAVWFITRLIHWRFFAPVKALRVWRQAIFAAAFVVSCAWLEINRALSWPLAFAILIALALVEAFLNIREREGEAKSDE
jgi:preprotein translocase subunit Sss1